MLHRRIAVGDALAALHVLAPGRSAAGSIWTVAQDGDCLFVFEVQFADPGTAGHVRWARLSDDGAWPAIPEWHLGPSVAAFERALTLAVGPIGLDRWLVAYGELAGGRRLHFLWIDRNLSTLEGPVEQGS